MTGPALTYVVSFLGVNSQRTRKVSAPIIPVPSHFRLATKGNKNSQTVSVPILPLNTNSGFSQLQVRRVFLFLCGKKSEMQNVSCIE